ncbi:hypothetical protein RRG08_032474 [Elysia crispata]|uniref:Uncharacterized protein n=1 Tax=Elysia crispata TaxID=231223 RepID=A0AAE1ECI2_9GAST|nr:hypothetical protein RRG08_032474 [Elysia crispata]
MSGLVLFSSSYRSRIPQFELNKRPELFARPFVQVCSDFGQSSQILEALPLTVKIKDGLGGDQAMWTELLLLRVYIRGRNRQKQGYMDILTFGNISGVGHAYNMAVRMKGKHRQASVRQNGSVLGGTSRGYLGSPVSDH